MRQAALCLPPDVGDGVPRRARANGLSYNQIVLRKGVDLMTMAIEELWSMAEPALIGAYHDTRRQFVEKKFARDTQRARLDWLRAKMFVGSVGGVTERKMAIDVSEELARKGQELREMTRDLDLLKVDVDTIAMVIRLRGVSAAAGTQAEDAADADPEREST
jgi:type IV pilus biogenesis protein CpaD/CtpE